LREIFDDAAASADAIKSQAEKSFSTFRKILADYDGKKWLLDVSCG
jgi:hypothetical protein